MLRWEINQSKISGLKRKIPNFAKSKMARVARLYDRLILELFNSAFNHIYYNSILKGSDDDVRLTFLDFVRRTVF